MWLRAVLVDRRIAPLFWAQFLGATSDNLFLVAAGAALLGAVDDPRATSLASALFIAPFLLLSGLAGELADKYAKARVLRAAKLAELPVVLVGAAGLVLGEPWLLVVTLVMLGARAALFGPAKYAILPEVLGGHELLGGNALIATGTFLAILVGSLLGGASGVEEVAAIGVGLAVLGVLASRWVPEQPGAAPALALSRTPWGPTLEAWRATREVRSVYLSVLATSWLWALGVALLALLPVYARQVLGGADDVVALLLAVACLGMGLGALLASRLGRQRIELGLVPLGALGTSVGLSILWLLEVPAPEGAPRSVAALLAAPGALGALASWALVALSAGLYTVPLYAMIQDRAPPATRARVFAGNNVANAVFMVLASAGVAGAAAAGVSVSAVFLALALLNAAVALYIYQVIPEFLLRFVIWVLAHLLYRLRVTGLDHVPDKGAAVLVANHVTFVDWLFVAAACRRPPRFVMYHGYFDIPVVRWFFRDGKVIPIAPAHEAEETMKQAFDRIAFELGDGELVCIFPEGKLSKTGELEPFRTGIERIIARTPVPVVPMALLGLWGSFFSRKGGRPMSRLPRGFRSLLELRVGAPLPPGEVTAQRLAEEVARLGGFAVPPPAPPAGTGAAPGPATGPPSTTG